MTDQTSFWGLRGIVAFHPDFADHQKYFPELEKLKIAIECLDGETSEVAESATHEIVLKGDPTTDLPRLDRARIERHIKGAMSALQSATPKPRIAHAPAFTSEPPKLSLWQSLCGIQPPTSQYFGSPWMPHGEDWPEYDGTPMQFVMQLDLSKLPQHRDEAAKLPLPKSGFLTLFIHGEDWDEYDEDSYVVIYPAGVRGRRRRRPHHDQPIPPRYIRNWRPMVDYCDREDFEGEVPYVDLLDVTQSSTTGKVLTAIGLEETEKEVITMDLPYERHNFECDKLGGWPAWEQAPEWPLDLDGNRMEFIYQVAAERGMILGGACLDDLAYIETPIVGRGQIFYSPNTGELRYVWSCD